MIRAPGHRHRLLRAVALVLASLVLVALFAFQDLEVRGSSMAPLLCGSDGERDRIVSLRHYYRFAEPARFDLVVFERPEAAPESALSADLSGDLFVKRIMALPGEDILIQDGDIFLRTSGSLDPPAILRKPYALLREQLVVHHALVPEATAPWVIPASATWHGTELVFDPRREPEGAASTIWCDENIVIADPIGGAQLARDVAIAFDARPLGAEMRVRAVLREVGDVFTLELTRTEACIRIERGAAAVTEARVPVAFDERNARHVRFANADDRVLLALDDAVVLEVAYPANTSVFGTPPNAPLLAVEAGPVALSRITVECDVHYSDAGELGVVRPYPVPAGEYFVLGDNSAKSRDSRHFGSIPADRLRGRPLFVVSPGERRRALCSIP